MVAINGKLTLGGLYTGDMSILDDGTQIRQIVVMPSNNNEIGFYLNEIHNKPQIYVEGTIEVVFWDGFFRPLVDLDKDVDISIFKKILDDVNNSVKAPEKA